MDECTAKRRGDAVKIKGIIDEDFVNYKKPSMVVQFPKCSFKCDKACKKQVCQNSALAAAPAVDISVFDLINRYLSNPITKAIVLAGLEPFDSIEDVFLILNHMRFNGHNDDIVIYTGYTEEEMEDFQQLFNMYDNLIIKYGRFIPEQKPHYDELLGIHLASDNQYAKGYGINGKS